MRIYFEHRTLDGHTRYVDHDPIYRNWPAVPSVGDHLSFDIGDDQPVEGNVRAVFWADGQGAEQQVDVTVRFS